MLTVYEIKIKGRLILGPLLYVKFKLNKNINILTRFPGTWLPWFQYLHANPCPWSRGGRGGGTGD